MLGSVVLLVAALVACASAEKGLYQDDPWFASELDAWADAPQEQELYGGLDEELVRTVFSAAAPLFMR